MKQNLWWVANVLYLHCTLQLRQRYNRGLWSGRRVQLLTPSKLFTWPTLHQYRFVSIYQFNCYLEHWKFCSHLLYMYRSVNHCQYVTLKMHIRSFLRFSFKKWCQLTVFPVPVPIKWQIIFISDIYTPMRLEDCLLRGMYDGLLSRAGQKANCVQLEFCSPGLNI